jgi:hypothetical protein
LGGGDFFGISPSILGFRTKKKFGKSMKLAGIFDMYVGRFLPIPAELLLFEIQKFGGFQYFWGNLATLFFKTRFWAKLVPEKTWVL